MAARKNHQKLLADFQELANKSILTAEDSALEKTTPVAVAKKVESIIEKWRSLQNKLLFEDDKEMTDFSRSALERILVLLVSTMELAIENVRGKLLETPEEYGLHDLLRVVEALGGQVANLKTQAPRKPAPSDYDDPKQIAAELEALEAEVQDDD